MESEDMVGKSMSSKQVPQKKAGKPSSSKGETIVAENLVDLKTDRGR